MATYSVGITKIEMGDPLALMPNTYQGSANITTSGGDDVDINVEEKDTPELSLINPKVESLVWETLDMTPAEMVRIAGGTVVDGAWQSPAQVPVIETALKVTTKMGIVFNFPRVSIKQQFTGNLTKNEVLRNQITAKILDPYTIGPAGA